MQIEELFARIDRFAETANPGFGRRVMQVHFSELHGDGSGKLLVEFASTQCETEHDKMLAGIFTTEKEFGFDNIDGLMKLLDDETLLVTRHPEINS